MSSSADPQVIIEIVSDVLVTATIAWRLCTARTGYSHTDALLSRLLKYASLTINDEVGLIH